MIRSRVRLDVDVPHLTRDSMGRSWDYFPLSCVHVTPIWKARKAREFLRLLRLRLLARPLYGPPATPVETVNKRPKLPTANNRLAEERPQRSEIQQALVGVNKQVVGVRRFRIPG